MADLVERFGAVWLNATLGATLFFGVVAIAMVMCAQPARRCTLARAGILGSLAILPLAVYHPNWLPDIIPTEVSPGLSSFLRTHERLFVWSKPLLPLAVGLAGLGSALRLMMLAAGWMGALRIIRKTIVPDTQTLELYRSLPVRRRFRPKLRVSAKVRSPMLVGFLRPTILIPPDLEEAGPSPTLRLALLHELVHAERFDHGFGLVSAVSQVLWFLIPPLWWICAQMRLDQEFLADLIASSRFGAKTEYASSLVGMAQSKATPDAPADTGIGGASLLLRILMLVRCPYPVEIDSPRWWRLTTAILIAALTALSAGFSLPILPDSSSSIASLVEDSDSRHGVLQMARLLIEPGARGSDGQISPYTMLMRLPSQFELAVDVWGSSEVMRSMKVCGWPLGPTRNEAEQAPLAEGFHRVRIVRDARGCSVWVHGRVIALNQDPTTTSEFLSFMTAPGLPGRFRNLILTW